jgi:hypothetical protein
MPIPLTHWCENWHSEIMITHTHTRLVQSDTQWRSPSCGVVQAVACFVSVPLLLLCLDDAHGVGAHEAERTLESFRIF